MVNMATPIKEVFYLKFISDNKKIILYCKKRSAKKYSHSSLPTGALQ